MRAQREERDLEDQVGRVLSGYPRGVTVERLRSLFQAGGSTARKHEIVRALRGLSARGVVQIGHDRKWRMRTSGRPGSPSGTRGTSAGAQDDRLHALPATALHGELSTDDAALPNGRISPDLALLRRLLPYYQDALKAGDGGHPVEWLETHGQRFVLLRPDGPWWPTARQGRLLRVPRSRIPDGFLETLAKKSGDKLLLGYPLMLVSPRDSETSPFLRPVAILRCTFRLTELALELDVPAARPAINEDWLKDQKRFGGWDPVRLRSWLLFEDEDANVREDDDSQSPDFVEMSAFASRLDAALRRTVQGTLDPAGIADSVPLEPRTGLYNALILMTDLAGKYTRSAIQDYDRLIKLDDAGLAGTAAASLFDAPPPEATAPPVLHPFAMSESQLVAARAGLCGPLTVVTGPPGTGKSQVIAALMASAAAAGKSVLFAARQHRSLDAVQERLQEISGNRTILVRASEAEGGRSFSFPNALQALLSRPDAPDAKPLFHAAYGDLAGIDRERWRVLEAWRELTRQTDRAAAARAAVERAEEDLAHAAAQAELKGLSSAGRGHKRNTLVRVMGALATFLQRAFAPRGRAVFGTAFALAAAERDAARLTDEMKAAEHEIATLRAALDGTAERPVALSEEIAGKSVDLMPRLIDMLEHLEQHDRQRLTELSGDTALDGRGAAGALPQEAARLVLDHFPLWAVTTLSAGSRIPLTPGLFDYVIFDEAAQADIASALPLFVRAKAGVVVGDPQQLAMISDLDPREERDLLRQHDLFRGGIGRFAQGRTSLYDLAATAAAARRYLLTDHFRCHPDIAGYINEAFYGRRLAALTDVARLRVPPGVKPGLHWTNVTGPIRARIGGRSKSAASEAEAEAVAAEVQRLVEGGFSGTIGVVAFFDYQSQLIADRIGQSVPAKIQDAHALKVFTANRFQGDERDVILLSLCLGPDMPQGARHFIQQEKRLLNVAVSRARAVCHVFGDMSYAAGCGITHIETLVRRFRLSQHREGGRYDDRFDSLWERRLYEAMVAKGLDPTPQYPVGGRFLDLALVDESRSPPVYIDIEVDGVRHHTDESGERLPTDLWRDHQLRGLGWKILRFWVHELRDDMEGCLERILAESRA